MELKPSLNTTYMALFFGKMLPIDTLWVVYEQEEPQIKCSETWLKVERANIYIIQKLKEHHRGHENCLVMCSSEE